MGRLFLIRHAQASFLSSNYDKLSALGETQARLLGAHWAMRSVLFDRAGSGPAARHYHSAQIVAEAYRKAGRPFPQLTVMPDFDEFQADSLLAEGLPLLLDRSEEIRALNAKMQNATDDAEKRQSFQRLFEAVTYAWVHGEIVVDNVEPWSAFCERVNRGLSAFLSQARSGEASVVFTSGGPIAVAIQRALHLSASDTLQMLWMSRNTSYTEFLFSNDRLTLSSFNAFPHLQDDALLTYR